MDAALQVEVWMRTHKGEYQYRGAVRFESCYLYIGPWLPSRSYAVKDAQAEVDKIALKRVRHVIH